MMKRRILFAIAAIIFTNLTAISHSDNSLSNTTVPLTSVEKIAFYSGRSGNNEIYLMNTDGSDQQNLTNHPASDLCPGISPGGDKIAFLSDRDGNWEIYLMNIDGTNVQRLTTTTASEEHPSWSPDGTKIHFIQDYSSRTEIWVMNSDGSNPLRLTNNSARDERPFLSPDGSKIVFMSNRDENYEIYIMNADGNDQTRITDTSYWEIFPVWSPDGTKIAYAKNFSSGGVRQGGIHIINPDGSGDQELTIPSQKDENPCWSPDGKNIIFQSARDGNFEIYKMNTDGSNQIRLTSNSAWDGWASWGIVTESASDVNRHGSLIQQNYKLYQNYPNPFNSETKIEFSLSNSAQVDLKILDIMGREINTLVNQKLGAGVHHINWNGKGKNGSIMPSGLYLYKIKTDGFCSTKKMIFSK